MGSLGSGVVLPRPRYSVASGRSGHVRNLIRPIVYGFPTFQNGLRYKVLLTLCDDFACGHRQSQVDMFLNIKKV